VNPRWKIFGACGHLIWSYTDERPYEVGGRLWCGSCIDDSSVESINAFHP
jgi:hypothetical protein